jgi:hypothetical protein
MTKEELADVVEKVILEKLLEKLGENAGRPNNAAMRAAICDQVLARLKALGLPFPEPDVKAMFLNRAREVSLEGDLIPARTSAFDGRYERELPGMVLRGRVTVVDMGFGPLRSGFDAFPGEWWDARGRHPARLEGGTVVAMGTQEEVGFAYRCEDAGHQPDDDASPVREYVIHEDDGTCLGWYCDECAEELRECGREIHLRAKALPRGSCTCGEDDDADPVHALPHKTWCQKADE